MRMRIRSKDGIDNNNSNPYVCVLSIERLSMNIWDKIDKDLRIERADARESICGTDYWILAFPNGGRVLSPYHCGTCDSCLNRKALALKVQIMSMAYLHNIKVAKVPPVVADNIAKRVPTTDYVRFPSSDGFDYVFFVSNKGMDFFDVSDSINWRNVIDRRSQTRKSGKLFYIKKRQDDGLLKVELTNLRASSLKNAQEALAKSLEFFKKSAMREDTLDTEDQVAVYNNAVTAKTRLLLEQSGDYVFSSVSTKSYALPLNFKFRLLGKEYYGR